MGKAKPAKHTAKEIAMKTAAATTNKGGGKDGLEDRLGGKAGHARYQCPLCRQPAPDLKSMQVSQDATLATDATWGRVPCSGLTPRSVALNCLSMPRPTVLQRKLCANALSKRVARIVQRARLRPYPQRVWRRTGQRRAVPVARRTLSRPSLTAPVNGQHFGLEA